MAVSDSVQYKSAARRGHERKTQEAALAAAATMVDSCAARNNPAASPGSNQGAPYMLGHRVGLSSFGYREPVSSGEPTRATAHKLVISDSQRLVLRRRSLYNLLSWARASDPGRCPDKLVGCQHVSLGWERDKEQKALLAGVVESTLQFPVLWD
ncbi:hypothetical protein BDV96DRAFT_651475 [Lophiotrema nucula]|uniref:Uncharacterized protein n=1 Tax=Lophiotrema nucula TaxID=690887 RepID=A0A6A5YS52_9PLEO|nr:hypothetical protein BDV96DRAFT_651475 [Lophiotrema nucula]